MEFNLSAKCFVIRFEEGNVFAQFLQIHRQLLDSSQVSRLDRWHGKSRQVVLLVICKVWALWQITFAIFDLGMSCPSSEDFTASKNFFPGRRRPAESKGSRALRVGKICSGNNGSFRFWRLRLIQIATEIAKHSVVAYRSKAASIVSQSSIKGKWENWESAINYRKKVKVTHSCICCLILYAEIRCARSVYWQGLHS